MFHKKAVFAELPSFAVFLQKCVSPPAFRLKAGGETLCSKEGKDYEEGVMKKVRKRFLAWRQGYILFP